MPHDEPAVILKTKAEYNIRFRAVRRCQDEEVENLSSLPKTVTLLTT